MLATLTSFCYPLLQKISPKLLPQPSLEKLNDMQWKITENNANFFVTSWFFKILTGWISINVTIQSDVSPNPKLYFDFGDKHAQMEAIQLMQVDEFTYRAEVLLPAPLKHIYFIPLADTDTGTFTISQFYIKSHSEILHILHQLLSIMKKDYLEKKDLFYRIRKSYARYKKHGRVGMLERLEKDYNQLYPFKVQKVTSEYILYMQWIQKNEQKQKKTDKVAKFSFTPLISVIMTTYNTPIEFLKKALDSVLSQTYPHWELCIADDASNHLEVQNFLREYMSKYEQIKVSFRKTNGHISLASNTALDLAKGEYVAFMDHDDLLAPHALYEIVKVLNTSPKVKLIYSDEDKIDEQERRFAPHFKSDWNPDMFYSQNYISHLSVIKKTLLEQMHPVFRKEYEGAQDYDLLLRIVDKIQADEIIHIPQILYHWRVYQNSTVYDPEVKQYTTMSGIEALKDYFCQVEKDVEVTQGLLPNTYKVSYLLKEEPLVSLVVPTRDRYDILSLCIESILKKTEYQNYEILIIDNQTTDEKTLDYFTQLQKQYNHIKVISYDAPFNYSAINNFAVTQAKGEIIGLINNDVEIISKHWLTEMVAHALRPDIGAVGAKLYYDNDTIQHAGVILGIDGVAGHSHKYFAKKAHGYFSRLKIIQNYAAVTAACLLVKKILYEEVGGLEEKHLTVAFNDVDFCLKLEEKGYRNLWTPFVELYHHESISRGAEDSKEKRERFQKEVDFMQKKWKKRLEKDKYYNKNLTKKHENFGINAHA